MWSGGGWLVDADMPANRGVEGDRMRLVGFLQRLRDMNILGLEASEIKVRARVNRFGTQSGRCDNGKKGMTGLDISARTGDVRLLGRSRPLWLAFDDAFVEARSMYASDHEQCRQLPMPSTYFHCALRLCSQSSDVVHCCGTAETREDAKKKTCRCCATWHSARKWLPGEFRRFVYLSRLCSCP